MRKLCCPGFKIRLVLFVVAQIFFAAMGPGPLKSAENTYVQIPWNLRKCSVDDDCALVHLSCGMGWAAVSQKYSAVAKALYERQRTILGCKADLETHSQAQCINGYCTIGVDSLECLLRDKNFDCVELCTQKREDGACMRSCYADFPGCPLKLPYDPKKALQY